MKAMQPSAADKDAHTFKAAPRTHPIDRQRLAGYLAASGLNLDPEAAIEQFATGLANINYRLTVDGKPVVLRRPPEGQLPPGAHDMKREHRILSRLHSALPLAPRSLHLCEDLSVLGVPFQIIEYRPGLVIKGDDRTQLEGRPDRCRQLGNMLVDTLVAVHDVDTDAIGLSDLGRPEGFLERAVKGWRSRAERLELEPTTVTLCDELGGWLTKQSFAVRQPTLLHCDVKLDNVILDPETFEPRAIIDWDMGTRGDPLFDLATTLSYWTEPGDPDCMHRLDQMPTAAPGFPSRDEALAHYARRTGVQISDFPALRVLAIFKLAVVFLQLHALRGRGPDADPQYATFYTLAHDLLEFAHDVAKGRS
jgi:aminoglycoside phosphotransferase (APT) family kinase protein